MYLSVAIEDRVTYSPERQMLSSGAIIHLGKLRGKIIIACAAGIMLAQFYVRLLL